jgi:uncharacterized protein YndB with AHSA1/START domain
MPRNHDEGPTVLRMQRVLPAPRERVFTALTRAEALRQWLCPEGFSVPAAQSDPRVGGRYRIEMRAPDGSMHRVGGVYREIRAPELLVFTWAWEPENDMAGVETTVRVELTADGSKTLMSMIHTGLPTPKARDNHAWGWTGAFNNLERLLAKENAQ